MIDIRAEDDQMMPDRSRRTIVTSSGTPRVAAFAVAVTLLLNLIVTPPLAMRMLSDQVSTGWPVALCANGSAGHPDAPTNRLPGTSHDHGTCPLCQCHLIPFAIIAVAVSMSAAALCSQQSRHVALAQQPLAPPFRLYSPRAPPALA